jgi:hypothetical protein
MSVQRRGAAGSGDQREEWPEWAERDPRALRELYAQAPENLRLALDLLAVHAPRSLTYREIDELLGWPRGRFHSVFGGWRSRRGTYSPRPFHLCSPRRSASGEWEAWVDEGQAEVFRADR